MQNNVVLLLQRSLAQTNQMCSLFQSIATIPAAIKNLTSFFERLRTFILSDVKFRATFIATSSVTLVCSLLFFLFLAESWAFL